MFSTIAREATLLNTRKLIKISLNQLCVFIVHFANSTSAEITLFGFHYCNTNILIHANYTNGICIIRVHSHIRIVS